MDSLAMLRGAVLSVLLAIVLVAGLMTPAFAFGGCEDGCWDEYDDCMADAEDWWGQCYQVCEALYYPQDPMSQAECQNDCDLERQNDEDVCVSERTLCIIGCQA